MPCDAGATYCLKYELHQNLEGHWNNTFDHLLDSTAGYNLESLFRSKFHMLRLKVTPRKKWIITVTSHM